MKSNNLNRVQLIGHLGASPKQIECRNGGVFFTASLATNESVKSGSDWKTAVQWHQLIFFGKLTKVAEHLDKGSHVYIEGRLKYNEWLDSNGNTQRQVHIIVSHVEFLGAIKPGKEADTIEVATKDHDELVTRHLSEMYAMLTDTELTEAATA